VFHLLYSNSYSIVHEVRIFNIFEVLVYICHKIFPFSNRRPNYLIVDNQVCKEVITSDTIQKVVQPFKVHDNIQPEYPFHYRYYHYRLLMNYTQYCLCSFPLFLFPSSGQSSL
jgi:hypothetical protein